MASDTVIPNANSGSRTPFVIGAVAVTFLVYIIIRGDLERYAQILLGPRQAPAEPEILTAPPEQEDATP